MTNTDKQDVPAGLEATGDCYEAAFTYFMTHHHENDTMRLVHGVCLLGTGPHEGLPFGHAWVEVDEAPDMPETLPPGFPEDLSAWTMTWCIDKSNGRDIKIPRGLYYHGGRPQQIIRYTIEEARRWALEMEHYGHWELDCER